MIKTRLIKLLSDAKKYVVFHVLWQILALISQIVIVLTVAHLLENVYLKNVVMHDLWSTLSVFLICILVRIVCDLQTTKASYQASVDVKKILRKNIYEKMLRLGASYKDRILTSEVIQMSSEGVEQLEIYFGKYLPQFFFSLLAPIILFIVLSRVNFKASLVLLICVPLIPLSIVAVQKFAKKLLSKYWSIYTGLGDSFLENIQGLTTLKIYQADQKKTEDMDKEAEHFRKITMKVLTMQLNSISVMDIVAYGGAAVGMVVVVQQYLQGQVSLAGTLTIVLLASEFFIPLRLLGSFFHIAMNGMAASDKIFAILDLPENEDGDEVLESDTIHVSLDNLHFSYNEEREVLKGISMDIPSGSFISLVGESGCGKSTIAGLICHRNRDFTGSLSINGHDIHHIQEASLMRNIALVRHNSYLFKGTVEDNLKMALPEATVEQMENVLQQVNLLEFLKAQKGLQTELLENASNLSGGQKQRLAIARALLLDAPLYIFDEATSNIDVESEELIMNVIQDLAKTKTVILISHRLANVVSSDCIYLLSQGCIQEHGTHDELMQKNGLYAQLYQRQKSLEDYGKEAIL